MIQLSQSRIQLSMEQPLYINSTQVEEGQALQWINENGQAMVTPGTGTAGTFAGIAFGYFMRPSTSAQVDVLTVPTTAPYTITLSQAPNNTAAMTVVYGSTVYAQTVGTLTGNEYSIGGTNNQTLTFPSTAAGLTFTVTYRFNLSILQAEMFTGDGYIVNAPSNVTGTIGVIQKGVIFTSNFDTSIYWGGVSSITVGAGGIFTSGGSGATVQATVFSQPTTDVPYLGLNLQVA